MTDLVIWKNLLNSMPSARLHLSVERAGPCQSFGESFESCRGHHDTAGQRCRESPKLRLGREGRQSASHG